MIAVEMSLLIIKIENTGNVKTKNMELKIHFLKAKTNQLLRVLLKSIKRMDPIGAKRYFERNILHLTSRYLLSLTFPSCEGQIFTGVCPSCALKELLIAFIATH